MKQQNDSKAENYIMKKFRRHLDHDLIDKRQQIEELENNKSLLQSNIKHYFCNITLAS